MDLAKIESEMQRLRLAPYNRKAGIIGKYQDFFINKIYEHNPNFPLDKYVLYNLPYEDLGEIATAVVNTELTVVLGKGRDFSDNSDKKCVIGQYRNNNRAKGGWLHSYIVSGIKGKEGALRVTAYNTILDKFEFFYIPECEYDNTKNMIEIVIEQYTNTFTEPNWHGEGKLHRKWWKFRVATFEAMSLSSH